MINVWRNQAIQDIHRQMIAEQGIVQKVLSTELSIVRGTMHLEHTYVVSHTLLERFVARCLLELAPCSTEQIAILLGMRNVGFVDVIVETFAARGYICKDEENKWVVGNEILRLCYERGEYQQIKSKPGYMFSYEWKHNFFLPKGLLAENLSDISTLAEVPKEEIVLDEESCLNWARRACACEATDLVSWDKVRYTHAWTYQLEIIVYQQNDSTITWCACIEKPSLRDGFKAIAQQLGIEQALCELV